MLNLKVFWKLIFLGLFIKMIVVSDEFKENMSMFLIIEIFLE